MAGLGWREAEEDLRETDEMIYYDYRFGRQRRIQRRLCSLKATKNICKGGLLYGCFFRMAGELGSLGPMNASCSKRSRYVQLSGRSPTWVWLGAKSFLDRFFDVPGERPYKTRRWKDSGFFRG